MEQQEIHITLMKRTFPVLVNPGEEEALRNAAQRVEAKIQEYQETFRLEDDLYPLLMCCLDFAFDLQSAEQNLRTQSQQIHHWLSALESKLDESF
jgi:cell division protein ZapA (FtsZ GTPase activity inhibitor)